MKPLHKSKEGTLNEIKDRLANGEEFAFWYLDKKEVITYKTQINFWRLDIIPKLKKKYKKETYVLGIERGDARWVLEEGNLIIDERHEFHTVEEIIDYLDKKGYLKKKDWIKNEQMKELDIVKLKKDLPKYGLKKGTKGTIVMIYGKPIREVEVEFIDNNSGETKATIQLPIDIVEVIQLYKSNHIKIK